MTRVRIENIIIIIVLLCILLGFNIMEFAQRYKNHAQLNQEIVMLLKSIAEVREAQVELQIQIGLLIEAERKAKGE